MEKIDLWIFSGKSFLKDMEFWDVLQSNAMELEDSLFAEYILVMAQHLSDTFLSSLQNLNRLVPVCTSCLQEKSYVAIVKRENYQNY